MKVLTQLEVSNLILPTNKLLDYCVTAIHRLQNFFVNWTLCSNANLRAIKCPQMVPFQSIRISLIRSNVNPCTEPLYRKITSGRAKSFLGPVSTGNKMVWTIWRFKKCCENKPECCATKNVFWFPKESLPAAIFYYYASLVVDLRMQIRSASKDKIEIITTILACIHSLAAICFIVSASWWNTAKFEINRSNANIFFVTLLGPVTDR